MYNVIKYLLQLIVEEFPYDATPNCFKCSRHVGFGPINPN